MIKKYIFVIFYFCCFSFGLYAQQPNFEWVARYQKPPNSGAAKNHLALDKLGNIYMAGEIYDTTTQRDLLLVKYNQNGDTLWTRRYNTIINNDEFLTGIVVDSIGNVYVCGYSGLGFGATKIVLLRYNPAGVLLWEKLYAEPGSSSQSPGSIILDRTGNIYVCAVYWYGSQPLNGITLKYNPAGDTIWTRKKIQSGYEFNENFTAIDSNNNLLVSGLKTFVSLNQRSYMVIKYDSNGNELWTALTPGTGFVNVQGLAIDANGNCYIACSTGDYTLIKYNVNGILQWQTSYNGPGNLEDLPTGLSLDLNGNIFLTGSSFSTNTASDYTTIKYNPNGDTIWSRKYNGPANGSDKPYAIFTDNQNNVYITGAAKFTNTELNIATIKYSNSGNELWTIYYNNQTNGENYSYNVICDNNYNVFISGISNGNVSSFDYITIKYSQTVSIMPIAGTTPIKYKLDQNFPNPFNPVTQIKFEILKNNTFTRITVYDITGKEIQTLVNEKLNKGTYLITFDAVNHSSGVYFYKIFTDDYSDTKKMMLIK